MAMMLSFSSRPVPVLSLSSRSSPVASSFLLRPNRRPHRLLLSTKPLATASSELQPPVPCDDPTATGNPDADPTPLFLRPAIHPVPASALAAFRRRASSLAPHYLHGHLRLLLADAGADAAAGSDPALLRAPLHVLEALWLGHVRGKRPIQYVVGNERWRDLVVAVREGVLIPRPETAAVVDKVKSVEGFAHGWWADVGTGSGAIAVAVARELGPGGRVFATDISDVAIEVARLNVERYGVQVSTVRT
jgi:release factor glutamine methyltransferase